MIRARLLEFLSARLPTLHFNMMLSGRANALHISHAMSNGRGHQSQEGRKAIRIPVTCWSGIKNAPFKSTRSPLTKRSDQKSFLNPSHDRKSRLADFRVQAEVGNLTGLLQVLEYSEPDYPTEARCRKWISRLWMCAGRTQRTTILTGC